MKREDIQSILSKYLPPDAVEPCTDWIIQHKVKLKITRSRSSRYGDYTSPRNGDGHIITVNHNLNKYFFLLTFVHELAHLLSHEKYRRRISPHGMEWKNEFIRLLDPFSLRKFFPADLAHAIERYMNNPAASSCTDINLMRALKRYDADKDKNIFHLEDLPHESVFRLADEKKPARQRDGSQVAGGGARYRKGEKLRKRFRCIEINSQTLYLVSPIAEVELIEIPKSPPKKVVQLSVFEME